MSGLRGGFEEECGRRGSVALLLLSFNFGVVSSVGGGLEEAGQNMVLGSIP